MAFAFVQQKSQSSGSTGQFAVVTGSFGASVTAGNLIWWVVNYSAASAQTITWSDTQSLTFTEIGNFHNGSNYGVRWGYCKNITGGAETITATFGGSVDFPAIYVAEYSGFDTTAPFTTGETASNEQTNPGTGAGAVTSGNSPSLAAQPAGVIGFSFNANGTVLPSAANGTSRTQVWNFANNGDSGGTLTARPEDRRVTATTAVASTFTIASGTDKYYTVEAVFKETGAVGGTNAGLVVTETKDSVVAGLTGSIAAGLLKTESSDTIVAGSTNAVAASLIKTESADTIVAGATAPTGTRTATFGVTETSDSIRASFSAWQVLDTYTLTPTLTLSNSINAALVVTEAADSLVSGATRVAQNVSFTVTEASDTITASIVGWQVLDTYTVVPTLTLLNSTNAALNVTETRDSITTQVLVTSPHPVGIISRLGFDGYGVKRTGSFAGRVPQNPATFRVTETSDSVTARGTVALNVSLVVTEASDILTANNSTGVNATLTVLEAGDSLASGGITIAPPISAALNLTEAGDTYTGDVTGGTPIPVVASGGGRGGSRHHRKLRILPDGRKVMATDAEVPGLLASIKRENTKPLEQQKKAPTPIQAEVTVDFQPLPQVDVSKPKLKVEKKEEVDYEFIRRKAEEEKFFNILMEII